MCGSHTRFSIPIPIPGGQEGVLLFCEDAPILDLALDPCDNFESIWVATTNTWVNKWVSGCSRKQLCRQTCMVQEYTHVCSH